MLRNISWLWVTMEAYCVRFRKNTANKNLSVRKTRQNRLMFLSNLLFVARKNQLSLKIKNSTILITFEVISLKWIQSLTNFLLTRDKFIHGMLLKQPGFPYSACGPFTKHRERIQKYRETGNLKHIEMN